MKINETVAVVIGGARGIGRAVVDALLAANAKVVIGDILKSEGAQTEKELASKYPGTAVKFVICDVCRDNEIKDTLKTAVDLYGRLDIVVGMAGLIDEIQWQKTIDINLNGVIRTTFASMEIMDKSRGGRGGVIILMASVAGLRPAPLGPVYAASKHGVVGFTRSIGRLRKMTGVRVNCICPTRVDTKLFDKISEGHPNPDHAKEITEDFKKSSKLRPEKIAQVIIDVIEDDTKSGHSVLVTEGRGVEYIHPPVTSNQ